MATTAEFGLIDTHVHIWQRSRFNYHWLTSGSAVSALCLAVTIHLVWTRLPTGTSSKFYKQQPNHSQRQSEGQSSVKMHFEPINYDKGADKYERAKS